MRAGRWRCQEFSSAYLPYLCGKTGCSPRGARPTGRLAKSGVFPAVRTAFTLAELLVVIAIIALAALISIPSIVYLMKDTATSQATVQMQAALAQARGLAITTHAPAAAIFYEDPGFTEQSAVFYATAAPGQGNPGASSGTTASLGTTPYVFVTDTNVQPIFFPKGIYVAGYVGPFAMNLNTSEQTVTATGSSAGSSYTGQMDDSNGQPTGYLFPDPAAIGQLYSGQANGAQPNTGLPPSGGNPPDASDPLRAVVFLPDGRSVICPSFVVENVPLDGVPITPPPAAFYYGQGPSCIGLSVYDAAQLTAAEKASQGALGSYLVPSDTATATTPPYATAVPLYIVNTYTGQLMGGQP